MIKTIEIRSMNQKIALNRVVYGTGTTSPQSVVHQLEGWNMQHIFYAMASILLVVWAINYFVYQAGAIIHLSLLNAIVLALVGKVVRKKTSKRKEH